jgi:hypothetical protein
LTYVDDIIFKEVCYMKNKLTLSKGIFALTLIFGFIVIGCPTDPGNGNVSKFTITFDATGGTVSPSSVEVEEGKTLTVLPVPSKAGEDKNFWGWYVDENV